MIDRMYASRYHATYRGKEQLTLSTRPDGRKIIVSETTEEDN